MPFYRDLDPNTAEGARTLLRLTALKEALDVVPNKTVDDRLLLATWNIREFDSPAYGERTSEALAYLAEILSRFDIVAVQEVRRDLAALKRLAVRLGPWWKFIVSDVTEGRRGNQERMAFLYDSRKVRFSGVAGEIAIPPVKRKGSQILEPAKQLARSPYMVGFEAGWSRFLLTTTHILYGKAIANDPEREAEIRAVAEFMRKRAENPSSWSHNVILLGDFNIFRPGDVTMKALTDSGFVVPESLQSLPSNAAKNKHYDQIAYRLDADRLVPTGRGGVFDCFETVYRTSDEADYASAMGGRYQESSRGKPRTARGKSRYYKSYWRTHQISDHLPMWMEFRIDFGQEYLERKLSSRPPEIVSDARLA